MEIALPRSPLYSTPVAPRSTSSPVGQFSAVAHEYRCRHLSFRGECSTWLSVVCLSVCGLHVVVVVVVAAVAVAVVLQKSKSNIVEAHRKMVSIERVCDWVWFVCVWSDVYRSCQSNSSKCYIKVWGRARSVAETSNWAGGGAADITFQAQPRPVCVVLALSSYTTDRYVSYWRCLATEQSSVECRDYKRCHCCMTGVVRCQRKATIELCWLYRL